MMIQDWKKSLLSDGQFLKLTLENPMCLPAFEFLTQHHIKVEVWDTGIIVLNPPQQLTQRDIVLSSGIHGNETAPIELCQDLLAQILTSQLNITERVLFIFGNPPAINLYKREVEENLNTLFSGNHSKDPNQKNAERVRGNLIETMITRFYSEAPKNEKRSRYLYDLHTAIRGSLFEKFAIQPYLHDQPYNPEQFDFLQSCEVATVLMMKSPATTLSYYGAQTHQAHSLTIELGKVRPFGENDMSRFDACKMTLIRLIQGLPLKTKEFVPEKFHFFDVKKSIPKLTQKFQLHFPNDLPNFTTYPIGTLIASDDGLEHRIEAEGDAIVFPNPHVAIGHRAMWIVCPKAYPFETDSTGNAIVSK